MSVFISWSEKGSLSYEMAKSLTGILKRMNIDVFFSEEMEAGVRWREKLDNELNRCDLAIICVTTDSINSQWLNYEAGAISRSFVNERKNNVIPLVFDIKVEDLRSSPLEQFQSVFLDEEGINKLTKKLKEIGSLNISKEEKLKTTLGKELINIHEQAFWNVFKPGLTENDPVYIVLSPKGTGRKFVYGISTHEKGHTEKVSFNEVMGFKTIQERMVALFGNEVIHNLKLTHANQITHINQDKPFEKSLIVFGSPHANSICKNIIGQWNINHQSSPIPCGFSSKKASLHKVFKFIEIEGDRYPEKIPDENNLTEDYGLIIRLTNPFNPRKKTLILGGNFGLGTESAALATTDYKIVKEIQSKTNDKDFVALIKGQTRDTVTYNPQIKVLKVYYENTWQTKLKIKD